MKKVKEEVKDGKQHLLISPPYRVMAEVLSDEQMREQMLADALFDLEIFRNKYKRLRELAVVFAAIKKVKRR